MTALVPTSGAAPSVVTVNGRAVEVNDGEPRIRDVDLAERAGLKQPRNIRTLIERCREELEDFGRLDMRIRRVRISKPRGGYEEREVAEFWLNEHQATTILVQLRTPQVRRLRRAVVDVFVAYRRGLLPTPQQISVLSSAPLLGDSQLRTEFAARCTTETATGSTTSSGPTRCCSARPELQCARWLTGRRYPSIGVRRRGDRSGESGLW